MAMDSSMNISARSSETKAGGLSNNQLELVTRADCDRYEVARIPETLSFEKGAYIFIRACQLLTQKNEGVTFVGLAGPSGAGKTIFCEKVVNLLPGIVSISMDNYYDSSRVIDGNYDDPRLTDYDTLLQNINDLKEGKSVKVPIYDFKLSKRTGYSDVDVPPSGIVIIEGIYALSERLRSLLDLRVSITGGVHFDLVKRVLRDINRSGKAPADTIQQISETVYPMYKVYIEPDLETAHIKIVNKFDPFSGFQTPKYILKSTRIATVEKIKEILSTDHTEKFEEICDIYLLPPGEDPETPQSYLRMRNRDGKYSLMFEEWVADNPFIISPSITFEVSVRLLGGLMALGYTIKTILKRTTRMIFDDAVVVKIDKPDRLHRKYMQVQGKDRVRVAEVASKLGLDGSYVPYSYIEQIELEKLTAEVLILADDMKSKLDYPPPAKDLPMFSWISNDVRTLDSRHRFEDRGYYRLLEQMTSINERFDEILSHLAKLGNRIPDSGSEGQLVTQGSAVDSFGNHPIDVCPIGKPIGFGMSCIVAASNISGTGSDRGIIDEVKCLGQGQRHLTEQLDEVNNLLRENIAHKHRNKINSRTGKGILESRGSRFSDLAIAASLVGFVVGIVVGMLLLRTWRRS